MSILGKFFDKIFGSQDQANPVVPSASTAAPPPNTDSLSASPAKKPSPASLQPQTLDVGAIIDSAVAKKRQKLDWRTSIVDLMKALDVDSSLQARQELARELGYQGDQSESANMNIWLHAQIMKKLAENGGKLPEDLETSARR